MNIKNFFRFNKIKIIFTLLFLLVFLLFKTEIPVFDATYIKHGFPLPLLERRIDTGWDIGHTSYRVLPLGMVVDVLSWYLISCLIMSVYSKYKKPV